MTENERAIMAINEAARAEDRSYGQYVALHTAEELRAVIADWTPKPKERTKEE